MRPQLFLIAGPNGAGKTTLYEHTLLNAPAIAPLPFVNADLIAKDLTRPDSAPTARAAQQEADRRRAQLLRRRQSFCTETVFSHPSRLELIRQAKAAGYTVVFFFVAVDSTQLSLARVRYRVNAKGGHDVPADRIAQRYHRSLAQAALAVPLVDYAFVLDNSIAGEPHRLMSAFDHAIPVYLDDAPRLWARALHANLGLPGDPARAGLVSGQGAHIAAALLRMFQRRPPRP